MQEVHSLALWAFSVVFTYHLNSSGNAVDVSGEMWYIYGTKYDSGIENSPSDQDNPAQVSFNGAVYTYVHNLQGDTPPYGYKGGRPYDNDGRGGSQVLPDRYTPYREYDVHPKVSGQNRGLERIVLGQGIAYYTFDHYKTCIIME